MAFARFFEFALLFWVPFFIAIYFIKQWKWSAVKMISWVAGAGLIAALLTTGVLSLIVLFD